jgi:hypothetical protein
MDIPSVVKKAKRKHPTQARRALSELMDRLNPLSGLLEGLSRPSKKLPPGVKRSEIVSDEVAAAWNPPDIVPAPAAADTAQWVVAEFEKMKAAGEIRKGVTRTDVAKILARRAPAAIKAGKLKKSIGYRHIVNNWRAWGLKPIL